MCNRDSDSLDQLVIKRECQLKGVSRSKLKHAGEFSVDAWLGGRLLDYRFRNASVIIKDIFSGEENANA
jgi:hypothetical protein